MPMNTALTLTDSQVVFLKGSLELQLGNLKSEIRHCVNSEYRDQLKDQKEEVLDMLDQICGEHFIKAA